MADFVGLNLNNLLRHGNATGQSMISRQNPNLGPRLNPHLLNDLPCFPQQTPHVQSRHHQPRSHLVPPTTHTHHSVPVVSAAAAAELVVALEDPIVDEEQGLLGRREGRHSALRVATARVGDLDHALVVAGDQLVHVDPRTGVLSDRLDDAPGLPDHPPGLRVVAEDPISRRHGQGRVRLRLRRPSRPTTMSVVRRGIRRRIVVVVPRPRPTHRLRIIVLVFIVVVPLRSRPLHLKNQKN